MVSVLDENHPSEVSVIMIDIDNLKKVNDGEGHAAGDRLIQQTAEIVGQLGTSFGLELRLDHFPPGPATLTIRTIHPPITNPNTGRTMTVSEYDWTVADRDHLYFGYTFDHGWEIAEGVWTKQIVYKGRVMAEKEFKIVVQLN